MFHKFFPNMDGVWGQLRNREKPETKNHEQESLLNSVPRDTPLYRHIKAFGGGVDDMTYESMVKLNQSIGDSDAKQRALRVLLVGSITTHRLPTACPFALHVDAHAAVGKMNHKQSTRIYKLDGTIDENRWDVLEAKSTMMDNTRILTKEKFNKFLQECRTAERDANCLSRMFGKKASDGEWLLYWTLFGEKDQHGNEFVKLADLREFYENSQLSIDKLKEKIALQESTQEMKVVPKRGWCAVM